MFESVLERNLPPRQIGRGATLAVGVHAVVLLGALYLSARPAPLVQKEIRVVKVFTPSSTLAPPAVATAGESAPVAKSTAEHRVARAVRNDIDKSAKRSEESSSRAAIGGDSSQATADPGPADGVGMATVGVPGGTGTGTGAGGGTIIAIPFGDGMQRPTPIVQPAPVYTREASAARSEGTVSVRCIITVEGTLKDCRIAKGVPYMDKPVLEALSQWKYTPVTFQGRPVSVFYSINLRLVAP